MLCLSGSFIYFEIYSIFVFPYRQNLRWGSQCEKFIRDIIPGNTGNGVGTWGGKGNDCPHCELLKSLELSLSQLRGEEVSKTYSPVPHPSFHWGLPVGALTLWYFWLASLWGSWLPCCQKDTLRQTAAGLHCKQLSACSVDLGEDITCSLSFMRILFPNFEVIPNLNHGRWCTVLRPTCFHPKSFVKAGSDIIKIEYVIFGKPWRAKFWQPIPDF